MSLKEGAGVRIVGVIERKFVPPSRKCAFLTLSFQGADDKKRQKVEVVAFSPNVEAVDELGQGQTVQVTAGLGSKVLNNKSKQAVQVDGRDAWVIQLILRTIQVEGAKEKPKAEEKKTTNWEEEDKRLGVDW